MCPRYEGKPRNQVRDPWANRGAALDVWAVRRLDRARYGGIVLTPELSAIMSDVLRDLADDQATRPRVDGLDSPTFHLKVWPADLDNLLRSYLESSKLPYDRDLLNAM